MTPLMNINKTYKQLLKRNETVMLFPGGAREALHGKGEEYKLFWYGISVDSSDMIIFTSDMIICDC